MNKKSYLLLFIPVIILLIIGYLGNLSFERKIADFQEPLDIDKDEFISNAKLSLERSLNTVSEILIEEYSNRDFKTKSQIVNSFNRVEKKIGRALKIPRNRDLLISQRFYADDELIVYQGFFFPLEASKIEFAFLNKTEVEMRLIQDLSLIHI